MMANVLELEGGRSHSLCTFYDVTELIGSGRFADVYKAFDNVTQTDVVLKVYQRADEQAHELANSEARILREVGELNTEFFPRLRKFVKTRIRNQNHPVLVMEYAQYLDDTSANLHLRLEDVIPVAGKEDETRAFPEFWNRDTITEWILDFALAVRGLHAHGVIHRDLKPQNILLKRTATASRCVPFIVDFNTSGRAEDEGRKLGTKKYLPPEVRAGTRTEVSKADDLWAVATVFWEMAYGKGLELSDHASPHLLWPGIPDDELRRVLRKALHCDPKQRYESADRLCEAVRAALSPAVAEADGYLTVSELSWARESSERIRTLIIDDSAGGDELPVPKDVRERVASLYVWLAEDQTRTIDLRGDVLQLGARAIPALIEESYKIPLDAEEFQVIAGAVATLSSKAEELTDRTLEVLSTSSSIGVRAMCRAICKKRGKLLRPFVTQLLEDGGLMLPSERLALASLCIQFALNEAATRDLIMYLCREYIVDHNEYLKLRGIARQMAELRFDQKAAIVVTAAEEARWRTLDEFVALPPEAQEECEKGLVQLLGDAFGSMGDASLDLLRSRAARRIDDPRISFIWRTLCWKLCKVHERARAWVQQNVGNARFPQLQSLARRVVSQEEEPQTREQMAESVRRYVAEGDQQAFNTIRFTQDQKICDVISDTIKTCSGAIDIKKLLDLLAGFENRQRRRVVRVLLDNWETLSQADYKKAVRVLTSYRVNDEGLHQEVISLLERDLDSDSHLKIARSGLEKFLGQG